MSGLSDMFGNPMLVMGFMVVVFGILALLAWRFWGGIKKKVAGQEKFPALIVLKEPKIKSVKLNIDHSFFLEDPQTKEAWLLHPMAVQRGERGGIAGIVLTRDSCFPQFPGLNLTESDIQKMCVAFEKVAPDIISGRIGEAVAEVMHENKTNAVADWLGLALMALSGCMALIVIGVMITSGHMPWD